jgi:antitoxin component of MazEF toxin-antitoxin module
MTVTTTQKIIKIGTSLAVTIPAKEVRRLGVTKGDDLKVSFEKPAVDTHKVEVVALTQRLIKRHQKALDNLSQR